MSNELTNKDYIDILTFYKINIPKSKRLIKKHAENIMSDKLCKCIKSVKSKNTKNMNKSSEGRSIGICTKTIFNNLHPYIKKGTLIAFDEWCYNFSESCNDHEQKAFYEYVEEHDVKFEFIDYSCPEVERKLLKIL